MGLFEDTNPKKLSDLLNDIDSRVTVLPDFQRDFVWDPSATQELIISIANSYPAGSLLRVRDSQKAFASRAFDGAPALNGHKYTFLVLDGQQRLTSLYQALYGTGEHKYFVDLQKLMDGLDFEEAIYHMRANSKWARELENTSAQEQHLTVPLTLLKSGLGGFLDWIFGYTNGLPDNERTANQKALKAISDKWFKAIDDYQFPVVTLSESVQPDALCTIFETLNRTGVKLTAFELLTARFWPHNVNLRELWDNAIQTNPIIAEYDVDPYYLLQAISLISRATPSCKRSEVLNLKAEEIREWWKSVVEGCRAALEILRDDCHVVTTKWLPYQTMITPLMAVLAKLGPTNSPQSGARREQLKQWFWCAVYGQRYESSPNSQAARDFSEVISWLQGGHDPETIKDFKFDPSTLREATPRQRAIYRGTICLILGSAGGARDFHTQAVITGQLIDQEGIDDHHIFPASYLEKVLDISESKLRDCVLNRTLIDRTTNQMISDSAPSDYLAKIRQTPNFPFDNVLHSHCLPTKQDGPLLTNDYEAFLSWRQNEIWKIIRKLTSSIEAT